MRRCVSVLFSEPKIPQYSRSRTNCSSVIVFQCSSASRKFLNSPRSDACRRCVSVSVLFSEPKIPQWVMPALEAERLRSFSALQRAENSSMLLPSRPPQSSTVSVLFSEPKIPQLSALFQRIGVGIEFQCSSASRKFLNADVEAVFLATQRHVSVLFSEPKIPQYTLSTNPTNLA